MQLWGIGTQQSLIDCEGFGRVLSLQAEFDAALYVSVHVITLSSTRENITIVPLIVIYTVSGSTCPFNLVDAYMNHIKIHVKLSQLSPI